MELNYLPSFCTACYGNNRTGERFMELCKDQQIHNFCHPNAIMTLKEYLVDYASDITKKTGESLLEKELNKLDNKEKKDIVLKNLANIEKGDRGFKF